MLMPTLVNPASRRAAAVSWSMSQPLLFREIRNPDPLACRAMSSSPGCRRGSPPPKLTEKTPAAAAFPRHARRTSRGSSSWVSPRL